jgi:MSHA biogenesis protein MshL
MKTRFGRRLWTWFATITAMIPGPALSAQEGGPAAGDVVAQVAPPSLFSFRADGLPIRQALTLFARSNGLNIVPDLDVVGDVSVEFNNLPLDLAMRALLDANGYYFVKDGPLIRVRNQETRLFHIDYIHTTRAGQGSSAVLISSSGGGTSASGGGGGGGGSGGGSSEQGSSMTVTANSTINFWGDLGEQLHSMLSETGAVTINSLAGSVLVVDSHRRVEEVARYLQSITDSVLRQIDLEVEIYEVALSNANQLGINWQFVSRYLYDASFSTLPVDPLSGQSGLSPAGGLIVRNPVYGPALPAAAFLGEYNHDGLHAVVEALKQQGNLKVVSKPRLRTLNNQPAVVRVGQDIPVFTRQVTQSPGTPPVITVTESIQNVTVGTVLSITPQVSADDLVTLDITPAVSRLVRVDTSASGDTTAPVIDIRQASSIVRMHEGDTVIMGGLVQESEFSTHRKIPILGDLPVVGRLFSAEAESKERSELVFFLTPRVIRPDDRVK